MGASIRGAEQVEIRVGAEIIRKPSFDVPLYKRCKCRANGHVEKVKEVTDCVGDMLVSCIGCGVQWQRLNVYIGLMEFGDDVEQDLLADN